jgi:hypothetical protein
MNMIIAVVIFVVGSAIQAGAVSIGMLFVGEFHGMKFGSLLSDVAKDEQLRDWRLGC